MKKPMRRMLIGVSIFFFIVFGWYGFKKIMMIRFFAQYQPPPVTISSTIAENNDWQSYLTAVGTLTAINGVDIASEVGGIVEDIQFTSGQTIKKDEPIVLLRSAVERANLKSSLAKLQLARINYDRAKTLFDKHAMSQSQLDTHHAELLEAEGSLDSAEAQLKQKIITAPFDGRLGISQINVGQFVSPNTSMVTLQSLNPLHVKFSLPEQNIASIQLKQAVQVTMHLGDNYDKTVNGNITAINAKVDQSTRTIQVEATIKNDQLDLYPGMYAQVKILQSQQKNLIVLPQTAVSYGLSGDYVFLIHNKSKEKDKPDLKVIRKYVKIGERRNNDVTIVDGIAPGDQIVTSGQLKLQNGTRVLINNNVKL